MKLAKDLNNLLQSVTDILVHLYIATLVTIHSLPVSTHPVFVNDEAFYSGSYVTIFCLLFLLHILAFQM